MVLLVGAGIGVTPFLSVIREIVNLWAAHRVPPAIATHIQNAQAAISGIEAIRAPNTAPGALESAMETAQVELEVRSQPLSTEEACVGGVHSCAATGCI